MGKYVMVVAWLEEVSIRTQFVSHQHQEERDGGTGVGGLGQ